jgi:hypothetical protein
MGNAAENRIIRAAQAAVVGRAKPLRILVTTEWRAKREADGYLGPVWRTPTGQFNDRLLWLPKIQSRRDGDMRLLGHNTQGAA